MTVQPLYCTLHTIFNVLELLESTNHDRLLADVTSKICTIALVSLSIHQILSRKPLSAQRVNYIRRIEGVFKSVKFMIWAAEICIDIHPKYGAYNSPYSFPYGLLGEIASDLGERLDAVDSLSILFTDPDVPFKPIINIGAYSDAELAVFYKSWPTNPWLAPLSCMARSCGLALKLYQWRFCDSTTRPLTKTEVVHLVNESTKPQDLFKQHPFWKQFVCPVCKTLPDDAIGDPNGYTVYGRTLFNLYYPHKQHIVLPKPNLNTFIANIKYHIIGDWDKIKKNPELLHQYLERSSIRALEHLAYEEAKIHRSQAKQTSESSN